MSAFGGKAGSDQPLFTNLDCPGVAIFYARDGSVVHLDPPTARAGSSGNGLELEGYVPVIAGAAWLVEHVINLVRSSGQFRGDD